jgi:hypothetical protein
VEVAAAWLPALSAQGLPALVSGHASLCVLLQRRIQRCQDPKSVAPITINDQGDQVNAIGDVLSASASPATASPATDVLISATDTASGTLSYSASGLAAKRDFVHYRPKVIVEKRLHCL